MISPDSGTAISKLSMLALVFGARVASAVVNIPADAIAVSRRTTPVEDIAALGKR